MKVPFIDLSAAPLKIRTAAKKAALDVLDSNQFILKENVQALEARMASKMGGGFAVGVASGSDALYLALWAMGIGPGDEVITTPFTFFATAGCISRTGAKPVFVDIDPATFNLDPQKTGKKITPRTKAILPVHLFGLSSDMAAITDLAKKHSLKVVEDAAQSFGATFGGRETGSIGDTGCFSFFPTKNLGGAGDGGMIFTRSPKLAEALRVLRVHGSKEKYHHNAIGINSRLDELQAAILLAKFDYAEAGNKKRRALAESYRKGLQGLPVQLPVEPKGSCHVYHVYSIVTPRRDELAGFLKKQGIGTAVYYPVPLHLQPCYRFLGHKKGDFPVAEKTCEQILALPMYPELSAKAQQHVISSIRQFFA